MEYAIGLTVVVTKVAVGLGFVIFVHELGHFLVAKLCGVKCEKFYLGFDIAGLKFCKFRWGETEYGIGILPLGGYVKMLGQDDNPNKIREEIERSKAQSASGEKQTEEKGTASEDRKSGGKNQARKNSSPAAGSYDPRSFLAKSVPKRMAIILAGVTMNVVFAFIMAVVAFGIGVPEIPCIIGEVFPGDAAWQAGLRSGDEVLKIDGQKMEKFRDLQTAISLGNIDQEKGVPFLVRRNGKELTVTLKPDNSRGIFVIGARGPMTAELLENRKTWMVFNRHAVVPGSAADRARPAFQNGDRIVKIDDVPIHDYAQINEELARKADRKITVIVERPERDAKGRPTKKIRHIAIAVEPERMRGLGLTMKIGPVTAIQADSPAAKADIRPGDVIVRPAGDPMTLPDRLLEHIGKPFELTVEREKNTKKNNSQAAGKDEIKKDAGADKASGREKKADEVKKETERIRRPVKLRQPTEINSSVFSNSPVGAPALGAAYRVLNEVAGVVEGSPAAKAGLRSGDVLVRAKLIAPDKAKLRELGVHPTEDLVGGGTVEFSEKSHDWPSFMNALQSALPGTKVELTFTRNGKDRKTGPMELVEVPDGFNPERGFRFESKTFPAHGGSFGKMLALGGARTLDDVTVVFRSIRALGTGQVPLRGLAGPITIFEMALQAADQGTVQLLLFLAFLSANLAVLNLLPIPVLDGGQFVLMLYEGIRGKPANEHVQVVLAYLGLAFIIALMIWVFGLDIHVFSRR